MAYLAQIVAADDEVELVRQILRSTELVRGCEQAAVFVRGPHDGVRLRACTDDRIAEALLRAQRSAAQLPPLVAAEGSGLDRHTAREIGIAGELSRPLSAAGEELGSLKFYSYVTADFDHEAHVTATAVAVHAGSALAGCRARERAEQLEMALESSREIGIAIGILMAHRRITRDQAFQALQRASQRRNIKLRVLASMVVGTGELSAAPVTAHTRRPTRVSPRADADLR